jgi:hypothetical protein
MPPKPESERTDWIHAGMSTEPNPGYEASG